MTSSIIPGAIKKKSLRKRNIFENNGHSILFYDLAGRRVNPEMNRLPSATSLYVVRRSGADSRRAKLLLKVQ